MVHTVFRVSRMEKGGQYWNEIGLMELQQVSGMLQ